MNFAKFSVAGKSFYKQSEEELHQVRAIVQSIDPEGEHIQKAMSYNTSMITERISDNHPEYQLRILYNATPRASADIVEMVKAYPSVPLMQGNPMRTIKDVKLDDQVIAQYDTTYGVLYILFDLVGQEGWIEYFDRIITELKSFILVGLKLKNDWSNEDVREELLKRISGDNAERRKRKERDLEGSIRSKKDDALNYERNAVSAYNQMNEYMRQLEALKSSNHNPTEKYARELNLIMADKKVTKLTINDNKEIVVKTVPLVINSSSGKQYQGGAFTIKFKPDGSLIHLSSDLTRESYWTPRDPHPHVDGSNGQACWGSVGTTLGQLITQEEFYAYVTVIINFLESANEEDVAGRRVKNWDMIKPDGTVVTPAELEEPDDEEAPHTCEDCGEDVDEVYEVFADVDSDGDVDNERLVCEGCRHVDYYYDDAVEAYVHDRNEGWND